MFPVDDPMNTFIPITSSGEISVFPASMSSISPMFLLVAPKWKPRFMHDFSFASESLPANAPADTVAGLVFGMSNAVVTPPATAARDSVVMSAL